MTEVTAYAGGQVWSVTWSDQSNPPPGTNHGSSGVCSVGDGAGVVLVSQDGERWELPAGRPEGDETLLQTLRREVLEEACGDVLAPALLGFTTSTCLEGAEQGLVLVRAHWSARVTLRDWQPLHEINHRWVLPPAEAMDALTVDPGLGPIYDRIWALGTAATS